MIIGVHRQSLPRFSARDGQRNSVNSFWCCNRKCAASLRLLAGVDQPLLVPEEEFLPLVLDLGLDIVNGIGIIDVQGDGFALAFAPSDPQSSGGAALGGTLLGGTLCRHRRIVDSFWMS